MIYIPVKQLDEIITNYVKSNETPEGLFYTKEKGKYLGLDNSRKTCILQIFETEDECLLWLSSLK